MDTMVAPVPLSLDLDRPLLRSPETQMFPTRNTKFNLPFYQSQYEIIAQNNVRNSRSFPSNQYAKLYSVANKYTRAPSSRYYRFFLHRVSTLSLSRFSVLASFIRTLRYMLELRKFEPPRSSQRPRCCFCTLVQLHK